MNRDEALKLAIKHIEHMAAWITRTNATSPGDLIGSYSFEGLGEDLPGIKAALATQDGETDWLTRSVAEVMQEDGGCWSACSGCQESVDGYVSSRDYPYSPIFKCQPGGGCGECGGIGVIWQDGDFLASYGDALSNEPDQWMLAQEVDEDQA